MQKHNLNELIEFNARFNPKVVINEAGHRVMLISISAGHLIPEHAAPGKVTIHVLQGHVTLFEDDTPCDLYPGEMVILEPDSKHRLHAHEDSVLLVTLITTPKAAEVPADSTEDLDIREVPRPLRHPMIFGKFDALSIGASLRLINDHDPIPLNRQFDSIRPGQALWEYDERGPDIFRIRITRVGPATASDRPLTVPGQQVQLQS